MLNSKAPRPESYNYDEPSSVLSERGLQRLPQWVLSEALADPRLVWSLSTTNDLLAQSDLFLSPLCRCGVPNGMGGF